MLRIQRSSDDGIVLTLVGRIEGEDVAELRRILQLEEKGERITLDLQDVTLTDREGVKFLAQAEADGIRVANCPAYIREWVDREAKRGT